MRKLSLSGLLICPVLLLAACQSVHTQSRIIASDPAAEGPPVIQIRSGDNEVRTYHSGAQGPPQLPAAELPPQEPRRATDAGQVASLPRQPAPSTGAARLTYNAVPTGQKVVAMTFDDGPHPIHTPKLLDMLRQRNIRATFYLIGRNVEAYPELVRRMVNEGHEIGNHTWSHPSLPTLSASRVQGEMQRTSDAIFAAAGVRPATMRPPYGATNAALNRRMRDEFGMKVILWSVDPQDWRHRNSSHVAGHITTNAKPGDIILAHDIHPTTVAAMPAALDALLARGFRFATVSELIEIGGHSPAPSGGVAALSGGNVEAAAAPSN